jgi:cell division protein ZapA
VSQSVVTIRLNDHPYQIGCGAGEEDHVANLGAEVESIMQSLVGSVGQIGEARLLAMVALILADRASTAAAANGSSNAVASAAPPAGASADDLSTAEDRAADLLEDAATKIAKLTSKLAFDAIKP